MDSDPTEVEPEKPGARGGANPCVEYNLAVAREEPRTWRLGQPPLLKSKLLFQEYQFGTAVRAGKTNTLGVYGPGGTRHDLGWPIIKIGSAELNDVIIRDGSVSRRHCVIVNLPGSVWLYDLGSTVGTWVDERRVEGREFLEGVHEVMIGRKRIRVASSNDLLL